jgi:hypothetical protein
MVDLRGIVLAVAVLSASLESTVLIPERRRRAASLPSMGEGDRCGRGNQWPSGGPGPSSLTQNQFL